jgi:hypothetical protein
LNTATPGAGDGMLGEGEGGGSGGGGGSKGGSEGSAVSAAASFDTLWRTALRRERQPQAALEGLGGGPPATSFVRRGVDSR